MEPFLPRQNVSADGLMLLNGGIHLSKAVAITRVREHLYHLLEVALPQHTLSLKLVVQLLKSLLAQQFLPERDFSSMLSTF